MTASNDFGLAPTDDPDLAALGAPGVESSEYDDLDAELTATVHSGTLIEVLGRPGYAVRCRTNFTSTDLDNLRKSARARLARRTERPARIKFRSPATSAALA